MLPEHFFVLMMENRSFDHVFGFSTINGLDKADPTRDFNIDPSTQKPIAVSLGADFSLYNLDIDPYHEFPNVMRQLAGPGPQHLDPTTHDYPTYTGKGFVDDYEANKAKDPGRIMHCFSPEKLPILNQLAEEFAICDHWFSSLPGPTWPNRFFMMAASSGGLTGSPTPKQIAIATAFAGYHFENGNIFDAMDRKNIDWHIIEGDKFPISFALKGMNKNALKGRFVDISNFESLISSEKFKSQFIFIEPQYGTHKYDVLGPGNYVGGNSMHPLDDVRKGELLIKQVYETIRKFPAVWEKSALLILFDEHGGFYDHAKPPSAVPPDQSTNNAMSGQEPFKFDRLGVRVPALVISPLIPKAFVDHTIYDHTSALATAEKIFNFPSLTSRDAAAKDLLHLFTLDAPRTDTPLTLQNPQAMPEADAVARAATPVVDDPETLRNDLVTLESAAFVTAGTQEPVASDSQVGFAYVALMRALSQVHTPEEEGAWKNEFSSITTKKDAARFMTRAKLKVYYDEYVPWRV
jgi:phospholipase C